VFRAIADFDAHGKHAQAVAFTKDGKLLVSVGQDARVRLWKAGDWKPAGVFEGHGKSVNSIAFAPDGKRLATSSTDGTVRVWTFPEGKAAGVLEGQVAAAFAPDGKRLATVSAKATASIWDAATLAPVAASKKLGKRCLAVEFSGDGKALYVGGEGPIHRIDPGTGEVSGALDGHAIIVAALRRSPDGTTLASTGGDLALRFWSLRDGKETRKALLPGPGVMQLAWAPDGKSIAASIDGAIVLVDASTAKVTVRVDVKLKGVYGVAISPDGRLLANAAADGHVRVWERG
jgi:WD40 repeat protein